MTRLWMALIAGVAFVVRASYAFIVDPEILELSDASAYRLLGRHLSEGRGYIRPYDFAYDGIVRPTAEFPPGYPTVLAILDGIGLDSIHQQRLGLAVIGTATVLAIIVLARSFVSSTTALIVGGLAAIHPSLFQPETALLGESVFLTATVALSLGVIALYHHLDPPRVFAVGLLGGAAALMRSEGLILALLLALPLLFSVRRVSGDRIRGRFQWGAAVALVAGVSVFVGGWAARNLTTFDEPVLVSNNLGSVLAGSNCAAAYQGELSGFWLIGADCFDGFTAEQLAVADESVVALRHRDDGLEYIAEHRGELPRVLAIRVLRTFQLYEFEQQVGLATFEGRASGTERLAGWIAWITYPLAMGGLGILVRRRKFFAAWILGLPIATVVLTSALTYGNPRFRIAAEVPMLLLAAITVSALAEARAGREGPTKSPE